MESKVDGEKDLEYETPTEYQAGKYSLFVFDLRDESKIPTKPKTRISMKQDETMNDISSSNEVKWVLHKKKPKQW
jgi:hypothetical protein